MQRWLIMKRLLILVMLLSTAVFVTAQTLNNPESIAYDYATDNYYVSNNGNGSILKGTQSGNYSYFYQGLGGVRGLCIAGNILYAATNLGLYAISPLDSHLIREVPIPGSVFLNDVVADSSGNVYISDNQAHKIFKYNLYADSLSTFISSGIQSPNGMAFDAANNRLLLVSFRANSPIQAIQLPEGVLTTVITTTIGNLDGIGIDDQGAIYFSSWQTNSIYRMQNWADTPTALWTGLSGPADFFLHEHTSGGYTPWYYSYHEIWIPNMNSSSITEYNLPNFITHCLIEVIWESEGGISWAGVDWETQYETGLLGFNLYYCIEPESEPYFADATLYNQDIIPATNTTTLHNYHLDLDLFLTSYWWVETVCMDGSTYLTSPIQVINVSNADHVLPPSLSKVNIYPNPVLSTSVLSFETAKSAEVSIGIYDLKGRKLSGSTAAYPSGKHEIPFSSLGIDYPALPTGMYFCRITAGKQIVTKKLLKTGR